MALEPAHLRHIARLARLEISDADLDAVRTRMQVILDYVDQLKKVDVTGVPPLDNAVDLTNVRRNDEVKPGLPPEAALANAPSVAGPYFAVPRIIDAP
jgi:aspartyl-tRNA(Asn)/glutamyl-tRNA(Gln) amidotransferase subunit C